jgi:long-chain acyl-CoA synthetase
MTSGSQIHRGSDSRIWLKQYPAGVPADVDATLYASLVELLEESFATFRSRRAFICMERSVSYGDLDRMSLALAAYLQSRSLRKGARVALMLPNVPHHPVATVAVLRAGYAVVNVNPLYTPRELEHQLRDSGAEAIIVLDSYASVVQQVIATTAVRHVIIGSQFEASGGWKLVCETGALPDAVWFDDAIAAGHDLPFAAPKVAADDVAFLQYTGGTTGVSKGATLLHRNVLANVLQIDAWIRPLLRELPHTEQLFVVCAVPLYHIFALTACFLLGMRVGGVNLLIPNPRDIPGLIQELRKYQFHSFPAVNTLYNALLNSPGFDQVDFSRLKVSWSAGMATRQAVADAWLDKTGCALSEAYGLSETSPALTCNRYDTKSFSGTVGLPLPSTHISIRGDNNSEVPLGEAGEICARGPQVMAGYWNRPEETAKVMTADGYFRTGDIGVMMPNGSIKIVDRKKDIIIVSGFNVYPNEVENVIASHPGVLECVVIGVEDARSGEAVRAFVVTRDPDVTADDIVNFCATQLTSYKVPKQVEFRTHLRKTNVGKILRRQMRDQE